MIGRMRCDEINGCGKYYPVEPAVSKCPHCGAMSAFSGFVSYDVRDWGYDIETYPNIFTANFTHIATGHVMRFEISVWRNDIIQLLEFLHALNATGARGVGYNNRGFDYPVLHFILGVGPTITIEQIYNKVMSIINGAWEDRFSHVVWDDDCYFQQIDLYLIHHFDNQARRTSLKMLEFNMRSKNIQDLPFEPGTYLTELERPVLIHYNGHDVNETIKFYKESVEMIEFRQELGARYDSNFLNHSDKKIGTAIFISELEKNAPGSCYTRINGRRTARQTIRPSIRLADIIFPYIHFERPEFQRVHSWLMSQVITKTKGVFEYLTVPPEMAMSMDPTIIKVHGLTLADVPHLTQGAVLDRQLQNGLLLSKCDDAFRARTDLDRFKFVSGWKDQSGLNCIVDGFQYDFGTGGIHGSIDSATVESDDNCEIWDWDVAGYYPSVGNVNGLFPEHLSAQFGEVDSMLKAERAKHKKGTPLNKAIKLSRNGAYGDSNSQYSPFFDSQYTMSITINGQLLLCVLAEQLIKIPGLSMIQINTDGLTVKCPRPYIDSMKSICKWWEQLTCLELESVVYSRMFIRDVNNYIGEYKGGKLKRKGAYEYKLEWHQNHSMLVVPRAAEAVLVRGEDLETFIRGHKDIFDFMLRTKVGRSDRLVLRDTAGNERDLQKITRYYVATNGGSLAKVSPPVGNIPVGTWKRVNKLSDSFYNGVIAELRLSDWSHLLSHDRDVNGLPWDKRINTKNRSKYEIRDSGFHTGYLVAPCNDIADADWNNINYDFYIAEARKLIDALQG
jgi:hypothetical protein